MRIKNIGLVGITAVIALISITASPALACLKPGESPGYWKHQFNAYIDGKGNPQETWANLVMWTTKIDARSRLPPCPWGLPPLASIDYDGDGSFGTDDAYNIFNDKMWNSMWVPLANWYNWAAGLSPSSG